ncbi:hypothetical protein N2152v2_004762 [Parachlorella kessleri]
MTPRRPGRKGLRPGCGVLGLLGIALAAVLGLYAAATEPDWAAVYQDTSLRAAGARYLHETAVQHQASSGVLPSRSGSHSSSLPGQFQHLWASRLELFELVASFRHRASCQASDSLHRAYRSMLLSRVLMLGSPGDPLGAHAALEAAGAELEFQLGNTSSFFEEAARQLGSGWHQPTPHLPACVEEMGFLLALREGRGARPDLAATGSSPEDWLAELMPSFDSSRELESMEHLGGHVEVAPLRAATLKDKPVVLWTLPADAELTRITIWSHAFTFDSEGERLAWRLSAMEEGGCMRVGVSPDKPLLRQHTLGVHLRLFWGDDSQLKELKLPTAQGSFSLLFQPGARTTHFPSASYCIPLPPATPPGLEVAMAAIFFAASPGNSTLVAVPSVSLAANKYYRVHAPELLQRYGLPPATPGFTHSQILASGRLHEKLWAAGFGANPTTSLPKGPPSGGVGDRLAAPPTAPGGRLAVGETTPPPLESLRLTCKLAQAMAESSTLDPLGPGCSIDGWLPTRQEPLRWRYWWAVLRLPRRPTPQAVESVKAIREGTVALNLLAALPILALLARQVPWVKAKGWSGHQEASQPSSKACMHLAAKDVGTWPGRAAGSTTKSKAQQRHKPAERSKGKQKADKGGGKGQQHKAAAHNRQDRQSGGHLRGPPRGPALAVAVTPQPQPVPGILSSEHAQPHPEQQHGPLAPAAVPSAILAATETASQQQAAKAEVNKASRRPCAHMGIPQPGSPAGTATDLLGSAAAAACQSEKPAEPLQLNSSMFVATSEPSNRATEVAAVVQPAATKPRYQPPLRNSGAAPSAQGAAGQALVLRLGVEGGVSCPSLLSSPPCPAATAAPVASQEQEGAGEADLECVMCLDAPRETTLAPCGHRALCLACTLTLVGAQRQQALCPVCRQGVLCYIRKEYQA